MASVNVILAVFSPVPTELIREWRKCQARDALIPLDLALCYFRPSPEREAAKLADTQELEPIEP